MACETATKTGMVMVFGEITTKAKVNYEEIVRKTCKGIGFTSEDVGLDSDTCKVLVHIEEQSPDIGQGVHGMGTKTLEEVGAGGWQGLQGRWLYTAAAVKDQVLCLLLLPDGSRHTTHLADREV